MKITVNQLRQIIKEEVSKVMSEAPVASAIPTSYLEFRNLVSNLVNKNSPGLAYALASEETPAIETGWMDYEDKAAYLADDMAKMKLLSKSAFKAVMAGAKKYRPDTGETFMASDIANATASEIMSMSPANMMMMKSKLALS